MKFCIFVALQTL